MPEIRVLLDCAEWEWEQQLSSDTTASMLAAADAMYAGEKKGSQRPRLASWKNDTDHQP